MSAHVVQPKESGSSAHANITQAELSAKYTNLKKRYFALDDVSACDNVRGSKAADDDMRSIK